jgi:hypothetical protein
MSLFGGTPNYGGILWAPQQFPERSGIEGFMEGMQTGMENRAQYRVNKEAWEAGGQQGPKPNAFRYFFGAGRDPKPTIGVSPEAASYNELVEAINGILESARGRIEGQAPMVPRPKPPPPGFQPPPLPGLNRGFFIERPD